MKRGILTGAILSLGIICGTSNASVILLDSQAGLANSLSAATVAITPHPYWQANHPSNPWISGDSSAVWISYDFTGYGDSHLQPYEGTTPVVSIFQSFTSGPGYLNLRVWADDTAAVLLDGVSLFSPVFTQSICSGQPIGCQPNDYGAVSASFGAGEHQLEFQLFQVGTGSNTYTNPFGLLYTGSAVTADAPEPGTLALAGIFMIVIGTRRLAVHRPKERE